MTRTFLLLGIGLGAFGAMKIAGVSVVESAHAEAARRAAAQATRPATTVVAAPTTTTAPIPPASSSSSSSPSSSSSSLSSSSTTTSGDGGWTGVLLSPTVELIARLDTRLDKMNVRIGDSVVAGSVLAELDTTVIKHQVAAAEASVRAARSDTAQAGATLLAARDRQNRRNGIVKYGGASLPLVSDEEAASARFDAAAASGRVGAAAATAQERSASAQALRAMMDEAVVKAPFDGTVAATFAERGAHLRAGAPLIRLVGKGSVRVRFAVPEAEAASIRLGTTLRVEVDGRNVEAVVDRISPEVESASSMLFVEGDTRDIGLQPTAALALAGRIVVVRPTESQMTPAKK